MFAVLSSAAYWGACPKGLRLGASRCSNCADCTGRSFGGMREYAVPATDDDAPGEVRACAAARRRG